MNLPRATRIDAATATALHVTLDYAGRLLRRRRLVTDEGEAFLVDLPHTTHIEPGDGFQLDDGRCVAVRAAEERLLRVTGDLPRLAWHIGNRHTPCEVTAEHLTIQNDPVLRDMLVGLGAEITEAQGPFRPEGGAYGHGRTMGHSHDH